VRNLSILLSFGALAFGAAAAPPNIVFMVADDLGWGDVSWHDGTARTPHLDQLRLDGMELTRYYGHATCTPTRISIYTGRNAYRLGFTGPIGPNQTGIPLNEHLLPETLRNAGYATHLVGKWHVGESTSDYYPTRRGFEHFFGFLSGGTDYFGSLTNGARSGWLRDEGLVTDTGYSTDLFAAEAETIIRQRDTSKPLFLMVCFNAPHTPLEAPASLKANYPTLSADGQTYAAMIESMDLAVGRIVAELAAQGMTNDTLVVFVSDNGAVNNTTYASNTPLRSGKGNAYEGGIRLPGIVKWPGQVSAGSQTAQVIADIDWFPTLTNIAQTVPGTSAVIDGQDLTLALLDPTLNTSRTLLIEADSTSGYLTGLNKVVIDRNGAYSLYDLSTDPEEANDLTASQPTLANALTRAIDRERALMRSDFSSNRGMSLINISVRARAGAEAGTPTPGFVIEGTGTKPTVLRAVGPGLGAFGVSGVLTNPSISLIRGSTEIASNSNWNAADATSFSQVGAFPLVVGSTDAGIVTSLAPGSYTAPVDAGTSAGVALLEVYDAAITDQSARLVNTSTRAYVGTGDDILVPGFVVDGEGTARLLIRAVGPGLRSFGVPDTLANPRMTLFRNGEAIATNDDWGTVGTDITDASTTAGAFALSSGSLDAALLVSLAKGFYTVAIEGTAPAPTGTALFELYLAPAP
jgi:arylsulfatase A-like enzyme